jgi:hypothetical protein
MSEKMVIGKVIRMSCMRKGLCAYSNETILVGQEALSRLASTSLGIPVVIDHPQELITDETITNLEIVGRVSKMEYDQFSDTWLAEFVLDNQKGIDLLQSGWGVSTAWFGEKYASGGTLNNVPYDRELVEGRYEHLAIVKNPRYEMANDPIFLNSKTLQNDKNNSTIIHNKNIEKKGHDMIGRIFKKLTQKEELKTNEGEDFVIEVEGKDISIRDLLAQNKNLASQVEELKLNKKNEDDKKEKEGEEDDKKENADDKSVDIDGEEIKVSSLKEMYRSSKKKNAEDKKEVKDEKKENSKEDEETQKNFKMVKELHENGVTYNLETEFLSTREKVQLGKKRYGSR